MHKTKMNLLPKKKVVPELTSFKDFYNHNILSITLPYIKKKNPKYNTCQSIFNSFYTSKSY